MKLLITISIILITFNVRAYGSKLDNNFLQTKDHIGRGVKLSKNITRIISLAPSITEILFSLEVQDKIVGVSRYSDYPTDAKVLPTIGSYISPDLEKIVALKPDLCLAIKDGNPSFIVTKLENLGIPVYVLDPKDLDSILFTLTDLGFILNLENKAETLVKKLNKRINNIKNVVFKSKIIPSIFFQLEIYPIISAGKDTFINDIISSVNARNVINDLKSYPNLNREDVIKLNPDIIIIIAIGNSKALIKEKFNWETYFNSLGFCNHNVFIENNDLFNRPSIRLIDGLELLARLAHPKLFEVIS